MCDAVIKIKIIIIFKDNKMEIFLKVAFGWAELGWVMTDSEQSRV